VSVRSHDSVDRKVPWWFFGVAFVVVIGAIGLGGYTYGPALVQKVKATVAISEPLPEIQARLQQEYPEETFTVHDHVLDGKRSLQVSLMNSEHASLDSEARRVLALGVARLAFASDPGARELTSVSVQFAMSSETGFIRRTDNSGEYEFGLEELLDDDEGSIAAEAATS
jgi:hypothetical protein